MTRIIFYIIFISILYTTVFSEETSDHAVLLSAKIDSSTVPPKLILSWDNNDRNARYYKVFRKNKTDKAWKPLASFNQDVNFFIDSNIQRGIGYEYHVLKITMDSSYYGYGYIYAGFDVEMEFNRNKVLLLVDDSISKILTFEINRFIYDLRCDGYIVKKYDVERTESFYAPAVLRTKLIIDSEQKSGNVGSIILLGRVAVPYSGNTAWDGHSGHSGAWPADLFYATPSNYWTDDEVFNPRPDSIVNKNIPHDGKFDETTIIKTDIQLGRIDMFNIPMNPTSEVELLRQYLDKDHNFKVHNIVLRERGLLDDGFKLYGSEALASNAWQNFSALLGQDNIDTLKFRYVLRTDDYLWSYGCNSGSYESVYDIAYTDELAKYPLNTVFSILVGSFNGDWDSKNNLLRGLTASAPSALCAIWAGRPYWYLHHMGLGETVGYSTNLTQNNNGLYDGTGKYGRRGIHVNLLGDPSLRMRYINPPRNLNVLSDTLISGIRKLELMWEDGSSETDGYNVYYSTGDDQPFIQANVQPIYDNKYLLIINSAGEQQVMVRAIRHELTNSGSYFNLSLGDLLVLKNGTSSEIAEHENNLSIYPNPTKDFIYLTCDKPSGQSVSYQIYNSRGDLYFSGQNNNYQLGKNRITIDLEKDLNNPPPGVYMFKILTSGKFYLGKFLIIK